MRVVTKEEFLQHHQQFSYEIKRGSVFIFPTGGVYALGCNALIERPVQRIRAIKAPSKLPFTIIAPSIQWIRENCEVNKEAEEWLNKLPGPYKLKLPLKNKDIICSLVNNGANTINIMLPDHWISKVVAEIGYPIVATAANHVGDNPIESPDDLPLDIRSQIDYIVFDGPLHGVPLPVIDLVKVS